MSLTLTQWLAVIGAVSGLTSFVTLICNWLINRPRLTLEAQEIYPLSIGQKEYEGSNCCGLSATSQKVLLLKLNIFNCGRQPSSIKSWICYQNELWVHLRKKSGLIPIELIADTTILINSKGEKIEMYGLLNEFPYASTVYKYILPYQLVKCCVAFELPNNTNKVKLEFKYIANRMFLNRPRTTKIKIKLLDSLITRIMLRIKHLPVLKHLPTR